VRGVGAAQRGGRARPQLRPAIERAAICYERLRHDGWSEDPEGDQRRAIEMARRALQMSPNDPTVLGDASLARSSSGALGITTNRSSA
jgi:hypothetical protein